MVTGPGEAAELLRRREVPTPVKLKKSTRKSRWQIPNRKPECMKESKGMKLPDLTIRKDERRRNTERCYGLKDWKPGWQQSMFETFYTDESQAAESGK